MSKRYTPEINHLSWNYFEKLPVFSPRQGRRDETHENVSDTKSEVNDILNLLKMKDYFPGKLSLQKVLSIDGKSQSQVKDVSDIPWAILHRIISVDFHFRENILDEFIRRVGKSSSMDDEDNLFAISPQSYKNGKKEMLVETLHPSDVFLTIFQCCDPFLKQTIISKVSLCQLAVPFIYPDFCTNDFILSLWPLRGVFLDSKSESVATESLKTIAFVRIGKGLEKSKSKIINEILRNNNEEHSTFCHRDCPLGMNPRNISNQLIEASWYVPSQWKKLSESEQEVDETNITERLTVLNLRGDASKCQSQVENMLTVSNIVVIFICYKDLKEWTYTNTLQTLHDSDCHILLLTDQSTLDESDFAFIEQYKCKINQSRTYMISTFMRKKNRFMNANELNLTLKKNISTLVTDTHAGINLEEISATSIVSDEDKTCTEMKTIVESIYFDITNYDISTRRKQYFTPLQCEELWQKWSLKQKQHHRPKLQQSYDPRETLLQEMSQLRIDQVRICNEAPDTFARFVWILLDVFDDSSAVQYFLYWMRYKLDKDSRVIIPHLLDDFCLAFQKYESAETKSTKQKEEIDRIESELAKASFGLEHFFRELGQVYEAFMHCQEVSYYTLSTNTYSVIKQLPLVAAKLLLLGQPLELMDGDAANVPLVWMKAVFNELRCLLSNKKLCSVSVLGIQSSGKSTLLNTMFGLNFAVSAGRCTRGIFAQIVPVEREITNLRFDYVLILDTEGLRAPEYAKENLNHDNELATFVIGLADIVVVNIKGETISDMEDILQIVVHGLLRLKQANKNIHLEQRSMFVHQNVPAEDAKSQMVQGNKKTVESLDRMTKEVALQEGFSSVSCFRDVIKFDPNKDVRFLPDLWYGTRPMAPVSHHYSEKAFDVRQSIIKYASSDNHSYLTTEDKVFHMESLWKGILADDFVFSFRNYLEIKAYSQLEVEFQDLISKLDLSKQKWMTDNIKPNLYSCASSIQIQEKAGKLKNEFIFKIREEAREAETKLKRFIQNSDLNEIMIQWEARKVIALHNMAGNAIQDVDSKIQYEKNHCETLRKTNDILAIKEEQIDSKAREIALSFTGQQLPRDVIVLKFNSLWDSWISEFVPKTEYDNIEGKTRIMIEELKYILFDKFSEQVPLINNELTTEALHHPVQIISLENSIQTIKDSNLQSRSTFSYKALKRILSIHDTRPVLNAVNAMLAEIDTRFDFLFKTDNEYDKSQFRQIIDEIRKKFRSYNGNDKNDYKLTPKFEVFVAVHVARYCCTKYRELIAIYEHKHGLRKRLKDSKPQKQQYFIDLCQAKSAEIIITNLLCSTLEGLIKERILRTLPIKIQREMINNYFKQKRSIIKSILEELAEENDFNTYMHYIQNPAAHALRWITKKTDYTIFKKKDSTHKTVYQSWVEGDLDTFIDDVKNAMNFATKEGPTKKGSTMNVQNWIQTFADQLVQRHFLLETNTFKQAKHFTISSISEISDNVKKDMSGNMRKKLLSCLILMNQTSIKWSGKTPYECIFETLWGCKEHCPFCGEPCQKAQIDHASSNDCHTCIQHRPSGIDGSSWKTSRKLVIETCNFKVQSGIVRYCDSWCSCPTPGGCGRTHPYKEYKRFYPEWDIQPSPDTSSSKYWN